MRVNRIHGLLLLACASIIGAPSDPLNQWALRNPLPQSQAVQALAFGQGAFVGVGASGTILTSADGLHWGSPDSGTTANLRSVAWGNGQFLAVGEQGKIVTSLDGRHWTSQASPASVVLNAVTFAAGQFIVAGASGLVLISSNGTDWAEHSLPATAAIRGLTVTPGLWIVVCDNGDIFSHVPGEGCNGTCRYANGVTH